MSSSFALHRISRALISVSDKTGLVEFAAGLHECGVEIISTGGTARLLQEKGIPVTPISDYTGYPEMLDGRVKTLHPKIHGGLLGLRDNESHIAQMKEHGIGSIDLVVVNLYPFTQTIANPDVTLAEAIEQIDIGGPTMLRSAAKNYRFVSVVCDPNDYESILQEMRSAEGSVSEETHFNLAIKVFKHTAQYDAAIADYLSKGDFKSFAFEKIQDLRYGENPHQKASFYRDVNFQGDSAIAQAQQLQGKELSFNNILDAHAALELVKEFEESAVVVLKHNNPCGVARNENLLKAYTDAFAVDPVSAFGGIVGFNRTVTEAVAEEMVKTFLEVVIAPDYEQKALEILASKPNVRLLKVPVKKEGHAFYDLKKVGGGLLLQDADQMMVARSDVKVVTKLQPTEEQWQALMFVWKVAKHVKSNAIVYGFKDRLAGIGAGQMSRVDSARLAVQKAQISIEGAAMASDAFFPFRDAIDAAAQAGIKVIIQPGGSMRDQEVIDACDEHGIAMVFSSVRHFKH